MKKRWIFLGILISIILIPLWMWIAWFLTPNKKMVAAIIDKSSYTSKGQEHLSFVWVLNYEKYTKTRSKPYNPSNDYFGFIPKTDKKFKTNGLERFTTSQIEQLAQDCDLTYYSDSYGVYVNEWYTEKNMGERSGIIYGGLTQEDIDFLTIMKRKKKLVISEFNTLASPTTSEIRRQFEKLFSLKWTGWTCRYFDSFDTTQNKELPMWMVNNYKAKHHGLWPFTGAGLAFVNLDDDIFILEDVVDLNFPVPVLNMTTAGGKYQIPNGTRYPYWFAIMETDENKNQVLANFHLNVTKKGAAKLTLYGINDNIPAVITNKNKDYHFFYLAGDFSDNDLDFSSSYFKGIDIFKSLLYSDDDLLERVSFFWNFYKPLMSQILRENYEAIHKN